MTTLQAIDILLVYLEMLEAVRGHDPAAAKVMVMAFRDWANGEADTGSGVPDSDLETRLSKVIEALT